MRISVRMLPLTILSLIFTALAWPHAPIASPAYYHAELFIIALTIVVLVIVGLIYLFSRSCEKRQKALNHCSLPASLLLVTIVFLLLMPFWPHPIFLGLTILLVIALFIYL